GHGASEQFVEEFERCGGEDDRVLPARGRDQFGGSGRAPLLPFPGGAQQVPACLRVVLAFAPHRAPRPAVAAFADADGDVDGVVVPPTGGAGGGVPVAAGAAEVADPVHAERGGDEVVSLGVVGGVDPPGEPEQVVAARQFSHGGGAQHPLGVSQQRLQRLHGGQAQLADAAAPSAG